MVLRHLCRPRDPCGAEIKAGAVSINDALALSIAELDNPIRHTGESAEEPTRCRDRNHMEGHRDHEPGKQNKGDGEAHSG